MHQMDNNIQLWDKISQGAHHLERPKQKQKVNFEHH